MPASPHFVELRAEEVQDLLTREPTWFLRWSITLMAVLVAGVFYGSWLLRMPDIVKVPFTLTAINAPKPALARRTGRLVRLLVHEGSKVSADAPLAYLESTARHEQVLRLRRELHRAWLLTSTEQLEEIARLPLSSYHQLGELQNAYQPFALAHLQLRTYITHGFYARRRLLMRQEVGDLRQMAHNLQKQHAIQGRELALAEADYQVQQRLAQQKVIPELELRREESKLLSHQLPYHQASATLIINATTQREKQLQLLELDKAMIEQQQQFLQALSTLQSAADEWKRNYIVQAPSQGRVYFPLPLQENQQVIAGQELFYVASNSTAFLGQVRIPQQNAGKVQVGQEVLIRFNGYPYQEFGLIRGTVKSVAKVPLHEGFIAEVQLPNQLITSRGRHLAYKIGMTATADIITRDQRLLERLFNSLTSLIHQND